MRYLSLFSGIGGFELGIKQAYENNRLQQRQDGEENNPSHKKGTSSEHSTPKFGEREQHRPICIGYSEIDKYAIQVYNKQFNHKNYGDITKINYEELEDFDIVMGGVPCQSWSIAGKRGGFDDERGNMWFECFKILRAKQPKYFLFENVKGLLSHDKGKSMERICEELCECGYGIDFEVLNSKNFGVPQSRERVFIIGVRLDLLNKYQIY